MKRDKTSRNEIKRVKIEKTEKKVETSRNFKKQIKREETKRNKKNI